MEAKKKVDDKAKAKAKEDAIKKTIARVKKKKEQDEMDKNIEALLINEEVEDFRNFKKICSERKETSEWLWQDIRMLFLKNYPPFIKDIKSKGCDLVYVLYRWNVAYSSENGFYCTEFSASPASFRTLDDDECAILKNEVENKHTMVLSLDMRFSNRQIVKWMTKDFPLYLNKNRPETKSSINALGFVPIDFEANARMGKLFPPIIAEGKSLVFTTKDFVCFILMHRKMGISIREINDEFAKANGGKSAYLDVEKLRLRLKAIQRFVDPFKDDDPFDDNDHN